MLFKWHQKLMLRHSSFLPGGTEPQNISFRLPKKKIEIKLVFPVKHGNYFCGSVWFCVIYESHRGHTFEPNTSNENHNFAI